MKLALKDVLALLERCRTSVDALLRQPGRPPKRAARLAEMLRSLWPSAPLYAALLKEPDNVHGCVLDEAGRPRPDWTELLLNATDLVQLSAALPLPGHTLAVQPITYQGSDLGTLALALPQRAAPVQKSVARALLASCSDRLAPGLHLEAQQRERPTPPEDLADLTWLANVGELAGPLSHEFNNFLNVVLLQVAVLEPEVPEALRPDVAEIRQQGKGVAALVRYFQEYRRSRPSVPQRVELNPIVCETVVVLSGGRSGPDGKPQIKAASFQEPEGSSQPAPAGVPVLLELTPDLPPVVASAADLKRLVTFLLTNAAAAAAPDGRVMVRTEMTADKVLLRVEDDGPTLAPELLSRLFEPGAAGREGTNSLELAACHTLAQRLQGKILAEDRTDGGVAILVELPAARP